MIITLFFDIAVKMITRMPQIESDSVMANKEDANEKGNFHVETLESCISYFVSTYSNITQ